MSEKVYNVPAEWAARAYLDNAKYLAMYERSVEDPNGFWGEMGKRLDWIKPYTKVKNTSFGPGDVSISWYEDGELNVSLQLRRPASHEARRPGRDHLGGRRPHRTTRRSPTASCTSGCRKLANVLKANGVKKGDRVTIYLPMIPEAAYAMLACARIGAVHSVVFGGFSPDSLADRINDADSKLDHHRRRGPARRPAVPLKKNADEALEEVQGRREGAGGPPHRHAVALDDGPRLRLHDELVKVERRLPARADERRGPAVHPLHLGLDRQAQGRAAHHRRLSRLRLDDPPVRLRLPRRRHLLVHGRRRLGHRPQLHPLRAARQRRHDPDVRGRPELPDGLALLGRRRQARSTSSTPRPPRSAR